MNNRLKQLLLDICHFCTSADYRRLRRSDLFDAQYYLSHYPDVARAGSNPILHYLNFGRQESRLASPIFDPQFYSDRYNITRETDALSHYLRHGIPNDHLPCPWFDPVFYRETYLGGERARVAPIHHFLRAGLKAKLYPNREIFAFHEKPVISILVPVYNPELNQLNNCIRSLLYQSYPHWELCLADDCSTRADIRPCLKKWAADEDRIKTVFLEKNSGISSATNMAAKLSTGSYIGFLDNDDELAPQALATLVREINKNGGELFYSDEDLIGVDGRQHSVFRKPAFNRELLYSHNYITHFVLVSRLLFDHVGGCNPLHDGAQDLDLFLRLSEQAKTVTHIPEILYHWRATPSSTSINHTEKDYANEAGRLAVEKSLARGNTPATVENTELNYYYRVRRRIDHGFSAALIVCAGPWQADLPGWLERLLDQTAGRDLLQEVVAVVPASGKSLSLQVLAEKYGIKMRTVVAEKDGLAYGYNQGSIGITADYTIFASVAITIINREWLTSLVEYGQSDGTGMVGGRIVCVQQEQEPVTQIPDLSNPGEAYYCRFITNCSILMNGRHCPQEVSAVNGEFALVKTSDFIAAGGFNGNDYPYVFATLDLCYRLRQLGKTNIFTPYSQAIWKTGQMLDTPTAEEHLLKQEKTKFTHAWQAVLQRGDPFYNDNIVSDHGIDLKDFHTWRSGYLSGLEIKKHNPGTKNTDV